MQNHPGFLHFIAQADAVGHLLLAILLTLSICTWYQILTKLLWGWRFQRTARGLRRQYWSQVRTDAELRPFLQQASEHPYRRLIQRSWQVAATLRQPHANTVLNHDGEEQFLQNELAQIQQRSQLQFDRGHALLASIASSAPFIGLLGTVWGIYHALVAIGMSGQSSLQQVAGPVGEALIMTAIGLAVALPAMLAFNASNRFNRTLRLEMSEFSRELQVHLLTGERPLTAAQPQATAVRETALAEAA